MMKPRKPEVIGIDPGGKTTAWVVLNSDGELIRHGETERDDGEPLNDYVRRAVISTRKVVNRYAGPGRAPVIGIEQIKPPNPHVNRRRNDGKKTAVINVQGSLDTARVIGGLLVELWPLALNDIIMVEPDGHGKNLLALYPPELVGPREKGDYGTGQLRHQRSAYDIAQVASLDRIQARAWNLGPQF